MATDQLDRRSIVSRITRRHFLKTGSALMAAGIVGVPEPAPGQSDTEVDGTVNFSVGRSKVVLVRSKRVLDDDGRLDGAELHKMLNDSVARLLGEEDSAAAWQELVGNAEVVGIKSNVWRRLRTPPELEAAIRQEVLSAGVEDRFVDIDDRGVRNNAVFQLMLESERGAMINVRPMRTHHWSGLGTCLKNPITFVPRPADYHDDACASIGAFWQELGLRHKTRLNILVMLTPQFHGVGPHSFSESFVWPYKGLVVGTDPVAVDAIGARIIEAKRLQHFGEERPISPPPHHIRYADARYKLGISDPERIDIIRLGWIGDDVFC
jgi:hypothetical protein